MEFDFTKHFVELKRLDVTKSLHAFIALLIQRPAKNVSELMLQVKHGYTELLDVVTTQFPDLALPTAPPRSQTDYTTAPLTVMPEQSIHPVVLKTMRFEQICNQYAINLKEDYKEGRKFGASLNASPETRKEKKKDCEARLEELKKIKQDTIAQVFNLFENAAKGIFWTTSAEKSDFMSVY